MDGAAHPFPEIWRGKLNLPLGAGRQHNSFNFNVWVAAAMGNILQVWSRSYSVIRLKAKKEQLKTEKKKILLGLGKEKQEAHA